MDVWSARELACVACTFTSACEEQRTGSVSRAAARPGRVDDVSSGHGLLSGASGPPMRRPSACRGMPWLPFAASWSWRDATFMGEHGPRVVGYLRDKDRVMLSAQRAPARGELYTAPWGTWVCGRQPGCRAL